MSSSFLFNTIDTIKNKPSIDKIKIDLKNIKKKLKNKTNTTDKKYTDTHNNIFRYKKNIIDLEKSFKDSLMLINMIEKQKEKNIFNKYNITKTSSFEKKYKNIIHKISDDSSKNILMKKKFLNILAKTYQIVQ